MVDFSIVIAHRGNPMGLWMTIQACEMDLCRTKLTREYIVVSNGQKEPPETKMHMENLKKAGLLGLYHHQEEPMSPPSARQLGTTKATGKFLCFFDNHCIPMQDFFSRAVADFEHYDIDMLHGCHRYDVYQETNYHYRLKALIAGKTFWGQESQFPQHQFKPYRVAMAGHGAFVIRPEVWKDVDGYWDGFQGYAGEEPYFDFKMAMLDKKVWLDPKLLHIHYIGERSYTRHFTDDYYKNFMMAAYIIGGEEWLYKAYNNGWSKALLRGTNHNKFEILMDAMERSQPRADWLAARRKRTFNEQIQLFQAECIAV